jgi:asparagine synthase (glutamine-hydrolysing)
LPKEITWRKTKIGFSSPIVDWMQNELSEWFLDNVNSKAFLESNLVSNPLGLQKEITAIVKKENSDFSTAQRCWTAFSPYLWEKSILNRK